MAVELVAIYFISYFDIRYSTRLQLVIMAISAVIVLALSLTIIFKGGASGNTIGPFLSSSADSLGGFAFGAIYGLVLFTGYESAAVLAEEATNPKKVIPLAIIGSVIIT